MRYPSGEFLRTAPTESALERPRQTCTSSVFGRVVRLLLCVIGPLLAAAGGFAANDVSPDVVQKILAENGVAVPKPFVLHEKYVRAQLSPEPGSDLVVVFGNGVWFDTLAVLRDGRVRFRVPLDQLGPGSKVEALEAVHLLGTPYPQVVLLYNAGENGTRYWRTITYLYIFTYLPSVGFQQVFRHILRDEWHREDGTVVKEYAYRFAKDPKGKAALIVVTDKQTGHQVVYRWTGREYAKSS